MKFASKRKWIAFVLALCLLLCAVPAFAVMAETTVTAYDFNGTDFGTTCLNSGLATFAEILADTSAVPAGFSGSVMGASKGSNSHVTVAVDFPLPLDPSKITSVKVRMYAAPLTSGSESDGSNLRVYVGATDGSNVTTPTYTAAGGVYGEWSEIDITAGVTNSNALDTDGYVDRFAVVFRDRGNESTRMVYYDSIIIESEGSPFVGGDSGEGGTEATESGVELFIRPGRENGYGALYLSAADSAPSGSSHSTHRYYPLAGEGSITIDGVAAPADYCLNKYGTDGNGGKWIFYSGKTDATLLMEIDQTVTISGKFACSEDPSYVIEFAEVHFKRTGTTSYAQVETAGGGEGGGEGGEGGEVAEGDVKLTIRSGRYTSDHLYLSAADGAASTTDYTTQFHAVSGQGGIYLNGALLTDAYLIKYGESGGLGKWILRMPLDGVSRAVGAGETFTIRGQFQSSYDNTILDFTEASFRCVAKSGNSYTWSEVSGAEHTCVTLSDLGIEAGDYCHVLTSANAAPLAGKEILFRVAHTFDNTANTAEGGRFYLGGTAATPRSGFQLLFRGDNTLNVYAPDGTTRLIKTALSDLGLVQGDVMQVSASLHYIDADADGSLDDAALRLYINGTAITDDALVVNDTALGDYVAFYENTGHTLSLTNMVTQTHLSLNDFGLSSGEYGNMSTSTKGSDVTLRGNLFEIDVTRHPGTVEDVENFVFIDYAARKSGDWEGFRVAHRADNVLLVHNLMPGTATYGFNLFDVNMTSLGVALDQTYRLGLQLDYIDKDLDGEKDDAVLSVYINGTQVDGGKAYILNAPTLGNALLIYGNDGDSATFEQVDFIDPNEVLNPFVFELSEMETSGINADGDLELFLKPTIGILGNPNEAVYATPAMTIGGAAVTGLTMLKTDFGSFKLVIPAAKLPEGNFTVAFAAGEILRSDAGNTMTLRADQTLYVNKYGVSLSSYVICAGENVTLTYNSGIAASAVDNRGIYVLTTDSMPVDTSWGTYIYPADDGVSGAYVNGSLHRIALKKYGQGTYYVCLIDYGYTAAVGDIVMVYGRYVLDNQYVEFAPVMMQWNGTAWVTLALNEAATMPPMTVDTSDIPLVLGNVDSVNGQPMSGTVTLSKSGTHTVVYRFGTATMTQQVTLYRPNDVDEDSRFTVIDAVQLKRGVALNGTAGSAQALASGDLVALRNLILGETKADDRLPTGTIGETGSGTYITSVDKTANGTTVFSMADTDNAYVSSGDFDAYGYDYVIDLNVDRDIKILQLSDPQIIDSSQQRDPDRLGTTGTAEYAPDRMEEMLFGQMREVIARTQPDLILITGDLVYGEFDDAGTSFEILIDFMEEQKVLWAPVYGNHCNESAKGVAWQSQKLAEAEYCVFNRRNEIGGNGNYSIGIAKNGELQRTVYMLDSNACYGSSDPEVLHRVGMNATQIAWYRAMALQTNQVAGKTIPSLMAWHIPTTEYIDGAKAACYQKDSDEPTYTIGVDNIAQPGDFGYHGEIFKSAWDAGDLHKYMLEVGTDGVFNGHSHRNSVSIGYGGVRWTFALKIGLYDREGPTQGGTLVTVHEDGFTVEHVVVSE